MSAGRWCRRKCRVLWGAGENRFSTKECTRMKRGTGAVINGFQACFQNAVR
jgi:hypothetical protein